MSDDYDPELQGYSLEDVCDRLDSIEAAIRANRSDFSWVVIIVLGWLAVVGLSDLWHSKMRYSWWYDVNFDQVTIEKKPTDCNFFRSPIGDKGCHYERTVSTVRVKTVYIDFQRGSVSYVSFDDGKTWVVDTNPPPQSHGSKSSGRKSRTNRLAFLSDRRVKAQAFARGYSGRQLPQPVVGNPAPPIKMLSEAKSATEALSSRRGQINTNFLTEFKRCNYETGSTVIKNSHNIQQQRALAFRVTVRDDPIVRIGYSFRKNAIAGLL